MNDKNRPTPILLAHRGTSTMAPENTAPAFEFGLAHGADVLEIDVRLSRDKEVIVIHDATVNRTTDGSGLVSNHSLSSLKELDAGYRHASNEGYPERACGVQLLTLAELFDRYPQVGVNIDIKDNEPQAVTEVARVIEQYSAEQRTVIASFHDNNLDVCRRDFPQLRTSAGKRDVGRFYWSYVTGRQIDQPLPTQLFQLPTHYFLLSLSSPGFIEAVHQAQAQVNYWTINKPLQMKQLLSSGADGIVTDRCDVAAEVFRNVNSL